MKRLRFLIPIWFLLIAAAFGAIVMLLWNWLIPAIFGLTIINFWQAFGLFVLAKILFGGFGKGMLGHAHQHHHKNHIREKWMQMTPEQRKEFINKRQKCGFGHHHFDDAFFEKEEQPSNKGDDE
jgi:ABC-type multidrug transport system fused ATPase/permease subunit